MWYIVYTSKLVSPALERTLQSQDVDYYIPVQTIRNVNPETGESVTRKVHPLGKLIFVKTDNDIQKTVEKTEGLRNIYRDHVTGRCAVVEDGIMETFRLYVQDQDDKYLFLRDPYFKFSVNDKVRVKEGPFKGQEGRVVRVRKNKRLVIELGTFAVCIFGIDLSILERID